MTKIQLFRSQALVSFKKYMPPPLPYFKVNICLLPPPHNIFRLFVILSLTQLYRYTPKIFLFSTTTFKYKYQAPPQTNWTKIFSESHIFYFSVNETDTTTSGLRWIFICIRNSLDRPCVTMPSWWSPLKCKVSLWNTDNCSNADYKNMFNSKLLTFVFLSTFFIFLNQFKPDWKWLYPFQWL